MTPLLSTDAPCSSGRFMSAVHDLDHHFAHHKYDVSPNEIEGRVRDANKSSGLHAFTDDPKDLVTKLIKGGGSKKWVELLGNDFCKKMKTTQTTDQDYKQVENKFKWYMIQDFFYCRALMLYDTERSIKATDQAAYVSLAGKIESHAQYAPEMLKSCTDKLKIPETTVFAMKPAEAITNYINFLQKTAEDKTNDWVASYVAMIPCIQSYFYIAVAIAADQSVDRDTLWYINWVEPNTKYVDSVRKQRDFFIKNADIWQKADYNHLLDIFNEACQRELDLWKATFEHN